MVFTHHFDDCLMKDFRVSGSLTRDDFAKYFPLQFFGYSIADCIKRIWDKGRKYANKYNYVIQTTFPTFESIDVLQ